MYSEKGDKISWRFSIANLKIRLQDYGISVPIVPFGPALITFKLVFHQARQANDFARNA